MGVFQLESEGMRRTLAAVRPTNFGDIIALVSLYRPGPMDNIPMFGRRKNGEEGDRISASAAGRHPTRRDLRDFRLSGTGDAGRADIGGLFSLGGADLLRRAMGKKVQKEMDEQRSIVL